MLPDLRGRTPLGALPATYNQGHSAGTETVTLTATTMPLHVHYLSGNTAAADQTGGSGHYLASVDESAQAPRVNLYQPTPPSPATTPLNPAGIQTVGASAGHQNMQPYLTIDFLVATTGLWPSRP
jgi:microcystin-dependent protein